MGENKEKKNWEVGIRMKKIWEGENKGKKNWERGRVKKYGKGVKGEKELGGGKQGGKIWEGEKN